MNLIIVDSCIYW